MKFLSTTAIGIALMLGGASAMLVATPATAATKAKPASYKLSDPVRKALAGAQEDMKAQKVDDALVKVNEAKAAAQTDDDRFLTYNQLYDIGKAKNDNKLMAEAIDGMLKSGRVPPENQANFNLALGQIAYNNKDYPTAERALGEAVRLDPNQRDAFALLAETKYQLRRPAEAVAMIQQAADQAASSVTPLPEDWFARGIAIGADAKLGDPVAKLTYRWLAAYPNKSHWRDSLIVYRDNHPLDADYNLDLMRLQAAARALQGERDYVEYAEATYLKYPNEAKGVVDLATAAGATSVAQNRSLLELTNIAKGKIAADKASLNMNASNGRTALATADAYASYADYASAITLYRKALTLGGVDANVVNTRLGVALFKSGQKDQAKTVFASITGPRQALATYWTILIDHPPVS